MRSYQVFAGMAPDHAQSMLRAVAERSPVMFAQALHAASSAMKARPVYLKRQPFERRAQAIRRALARVAANPIAEELLAVYFLECRRELLVEWLDATGIEHDEGSLASDDPAQPPEQQLVKAVKKFRSSGDDPDRELLLRAFAAQGAIEWPALEALFDAGT
jgi:hypothetical protein